MLTINGYKIFDELSCKEFLASLGLKFFEVEEFVDYLTHDLEDEITYLEEENCALQTTIDNLEEDIFTLHLKLESEE